MADEKTCEWEVEGEGEWRTACRHIFNFSDGSLAENGFQFCPFCGGRITVTNEADS